VKEVNTISGRNGEVPVCDGTLSTWGKTAGKLTESIPVNLTQILQRQPLRFIRLDDSTHAAILRVRLDSRLLDSVRSLPTA
jgi:hypothetical protein